jgi:hypothetical protein
MASAIPPSQFFTLRLLFAPSTLPKSPAQAIVWRRLDRQPPSLSHTRLARMGVVQCLASRKTNSDPASAGLVRLSPRLHG